MFQSAENDRPRYFYYARGARVPAHGAETVTHAVATATILSGIRVSV